MKMPLILKVIYATTVLSLVARVPTGFRALLMFVTPVNAFSVQLLGVAFISIFAAAVALMVIWAITEKPRRAYLIVALYPVVAVLLYPAENILIMAGYHSPHSYIPRGQLAGAASFELMRYFWFITMFVWFRFSKSAKAYLTLPAVSKRPPLPAPDPEGFY